MLRKIRDNVQKFLTEMERMPGVPRFVLTILCGIAALMVTVLVVIIPWHVLFIMGLAIAGIVAMSEYGWSWLAKWFDDKEAR